jgi:hypothetical protein
MWQKFDIEGIVHKEIDPPGQTVNGKFYCDVMRRLRSKTSRQVAQQLLRSESRQRFGSIVARCAAVYGF